MREPGRPSAVRRLTLALTQREPQAASGGVLGRLSQHVPVDTRDETGGLCC